MIRVVEIANIFAPTRRSIGYAAHIPGTTIAHYRPDAVGSEWACIVNGETIPADRWAETEVDDGVDLVFTIPPKAALVAWVAAFVVKLVVAAAISLAIQALLAPDGPGGGDSPSGFNPIANTVAVGTPIPVVYGKLRVGGNIIAYDVDALPEGANRINVLVALGEGRMEGLEGDPDPDGGEANFGIANARAASIEINGNPVDNYKNVQFSWRSGELNQSSVRYFRTLKVTEAVDLEIPQPVDGDGEPVGGWGVWQTYTTARDCDAARLIIRFPRGCYIAKESGGIGSRAVHFDVRFRPASGGSWTWLREASVKPTQPLGDWVQVSTPAGTNPIFVEFRSVAPAYAELPLEFDERGTYEIQYRRLNFRTTTTWAVDGVLGGELIRQSVPDFYARDDPPKRNTLAHLDAVEEVVDEKLTYPGIALMGVRALGSTQLDGFVPRLTWIVNGSRVKIWDKVDPDSPTFTVAWSQNPAWIALDVLTNTEHGMGAIVSMDDIDLEAFKEWADHCDAIVDDGDGGAMPRCTFNHEFRGDGDGWNDFLTICKSSRAMPATDGSRISVVVDKARSRVQTFTRSNVRNLTLGWINKSRAPNVVVIQFRNAANNYEWDAAQVESDAVIQGLEHERTHTIRLDGVTHYAQALHEATLQLLLLERTDRTASFVCGSEAWGASPGEVVGLVDELISGAVGGRVSGPGTGADTIVLDRDVTVGAGTFAISIVQDDGTEEQLNIISSAGDYDAGDELQVASDWSLVPEAGMVYAFGELDNTIEDYVVTRASLNEDLEREVELVNYAGDSIYTDADGNGATVPIPVDVFPTDDALPPALRSVAAIERALVADDGHIVPGVEAFWAYGRLQGAARAAVYYRLVALGPWIFAGESRDISFLIRGEFNPGDVVEVTAVAVGPTGSRRDPEDGIKVFVPITGKPPRPVEPKGLVSRRVGDVLEFVWDLPGVNEEPDDGSLENLHLKHWGVRRGIDWRAATPIGETTTPAVSVSDWFPGRERYLIRSVDGSDQVSALTASEVLALGPPVGVTPVLELDLEGWAGAHFNTQAANDGRLELINKVGSGFHHTNTQDLGAVGDWEIVAAHGLYQVSTAATWDLTRIDIGAVSQGPFLDGELLIGQTSAAQGRLVHSVYDGGVSVYIGDITGTFQDGEVVIGQTSSASATASAAPAGVTWEDAELALRDFGGRFDANHLMGLHTTTIAIFTSEDGLNYVQHAGARVSTRCRYFYVETTLSSDSQYYPPEVERLSIVAYDATKRLEGWSTSETDRTKRLQPDGAGGLAWV